MTAGLMIRVVVILMLSACQQSVGPVAVDAPVTGLASTAEDPGERIPEVEISSPDPDSERGRALAAVEQGSDFVLYSLQPRGYPDAGDSSHEHGSPEFEADMERWREKERLACGNGKCLYLNPVLGAVSIDRPVDIQTMKSILRPALGQVPNFDVACVAEYRHAISFVSDGAKYEVLLCYGCMQIAVAIDGKVGWDDQAYEMGSEEALDAILRRHEVPLSPKPVY